TWPKKGPIRASVRRWAASGNPANTAARGKGRRRVEHIAAAHAIVDALMRVDLRLYALVDPERAGGRDLAVLARLVALGGATLVQLRDKHSDTRRMVARARAIKAELAPLNVPLLINDRIDVALASGAAAALGGQGDRGGEAARGSPGADAIMGFPEKPVERAEAAPFDFLDYVGIGGVFPPASKDNPSPPIGPAGLARIVDVFRRR